MHLNRDVFSAFILLIICGFFINEAITLKPLAGQMSPALWPYLILAPLTSLSLLFLVRSLSKERSKDEMKGGFIGWFKHYKNPIFVFGLFLIFLLTLPFLGMLIGGVLFVFTTLSYFGGWTFKNLLVHGGIALICVGAMWSIFTFALGVLLPQGEIFTVL